MITDGEKRHYLAVKKVSALLRRVKYVEGFYCLNSFHSYRTEKKLKSIIMHLIIMIIVM